MTSHDQQQAVNAALVQLLASARTAFQAVVRQATPAFNAQLKAAGLALALQP